MSYSTAIVLFACAFCIGLMFGALGGAILTERRYRRLQPLPAHHYEEPESRTRRVQQ